MCSYTVNTDGKKNECGPRCTFRWLRMKATDSNFCRHFLTDVQNQNHPALGTFPLNVNYNPTQKHNSCVLHRLCREVRRLKMCEMHLLKYLQQQQCQRPRLNRNKQSLCAQHIQTPQAQPLLQGPNRICRCMIIFLKTV